MTSRYSGGRRGLALLCAAIVPAVLLAGCSGSVEIGGTDLSELEAKIVEEQKKKSPHLSVGEATCPDDVDVEESKTFECTVELEGVDAPYEVTLTREDADGDSGQFHFEPAKPIIDVSVVVDFIRSRLNKQSAGAEVSCGDAAVLVTEVGATFDCTVSDDRGAENVTMVVKNIEGDVGLQ